MPEHKNGILWLLILGEDWESKEDFFLEQKRNYLKILYKKDFPEALKIPVETFQNFDEEEYKHNF